MKVKDTRNYNSQARQLVTVAHILQVAERYDHNAWWKEADGDASMVIEVNVHSSAEFVNEVQAVTAIRVYSNNDHAPTGYINYILDLGCGEDNNKRFYTLSFRK
jgi:hypothetical protein